MSRLVALAGAIALVNVLVIPVLAQTEEPAVEVVGFDVDASEAGPDGGVLTFTRTGATDVTLDVAYTVAGDAVAGSDYIALSGMVSFGIGASSVTVAVTPIDDALVESPETVIVTLTDGAAYALGASTSATVTIADNDQPEPVVTVAASDATAAEAGLEPGELTFTRTGATDAALAVTYTVAGSATAGSDYTALSGTVNFAVGASSATVAVTPIDDALVESPETVIVTLTDGAAYALGASTSATVTIADNDALPVVTVAATDANASEEGPDDGRLTFTRTGDTSAALAVTYTVAGSATAGSDYTALSGTVNFGIGASTVTVPVTPVDDALDESDETVIATLTAGASYTLGTSTSATVTIADNDGDDDDDQELPEELADLTKADCKRGGWRDFGVFKNQGDCVSFVATGGKNPPALLGDDSAA